MDLLPMIGVAMTASVLCLLLRQHRPEFAVVLAIVAGVLLFLSVFSFMEPIFVSITDLMTHTGMGGQYTQIMFKALGICYLVELASDSCRDAGQTALASKVELIGRVSILLLVLPIFEALAGTALGLLQS